jgi:predicted MFS family arabinose efflux permease
VGVIPPTLLWQRERPEDLSLLPDGDVSEPPPRRSATSATRYSSTARAHQGWTLRAALRTPTLWLLFAMRIFTPLGMMMVVPHHVAYLIRQGFSKPVAALAFGSLGIFSFTGRIFFGLLSDRLGQITTIILTYSLSIIGTLLLLSLHDPEHRWLLYDDSAIWATSLSGKSTMRISRPSAGYSATSKLRAGSQGDDTDSVRTKCPLSGYSTGIGRVQELIK